MYYIVLCIHFHAVQRTVDLYSNQAEEDATSGNIRMTRRRASFCGGQGMILMAEFAAKLVESNDKNLDKLSCKKLAGELAAETFPCSVASVHQWFKLQHVNGGISSPSLPLGIVLIVCPGCSASTKSGGRGLWTTPLGTVSRNCHQNVHSII